MAVAVSSEACKTCGVVPRWFSDWDMCCNCVGSGEDDTSWDDVCIYCNGTGDVDRGGYECDCQEDDL